MAKSLYTPELILAVCAILGLLFTIIGLLWKFNNNVVKNQIALDGAVGDIAKVKIVQTSHGNKISEIIGAVNTRAKIGDRIEPLLYPIEDSR